MPRIPIFVALLLVASLAVPAPVMAARTARAAVLLKALPAAVESNSPAYERSRFKLWTDADSDGCSTRYEVLFRQNTKRGRTGCRGTVGRWQSLYDGLVFRSSRGIDIDHMIPLKEAWMSGARRWNADTRRRFANDLHYPRSLIAVSATSNRSKGDDDPSEWEPPLEGFHCRYAVNWIAVKYRWRLSVDTSERRALIVMIKGCPRTITRIPRPPRARIAGAHGGVMVGGSGSSGSGGTSDGIPTQPDQAGDQDCSDFDHPVQVLPGDPDHLDGDGDGIGCESS